MGIHRVPVYGSCIMALQPPAAGQPGVQLGPYSHCHLPMGVCFMEGHACALFACFSVLHTAHRCTASWLLGNVHPSPSLTRVGPDVSCKDRLVLHVFVSRVDLIAFTDPRYATQVSTICEPMDLKVKDQARKGTAEEGSLNRCLWASIEQRDAST